MVLNPSKTRLENRSSTLYANRKVRKIKSVNKVIKIKIAIKPNSSPITEMIKSDSCTGRNFK